MSSSPLSLSFSLSLAPYSIPHQITSATLIPPLDQTHAKLDAEMRFPERNFAVNRGQRISDSIVFSATSINPWPGVRQFGSSRLASITGRNLADRRIAAGDLSWLRRNLGRSIGYARLIDRATLVTNRNSLPLSYIMHPRNKRGFRWTGGCGTEFHKTFGWLDNAHFSLVASAFLVCTVLKQSTVSSLLAEDVFTYRDLDLVSSVELYCKVWMIDWTRGLYCLAIWWRRYVWETRWLCLENVYWFFLNNCKRKIRNESF